MKSFSGGTAEYTGWSFSRAQHMARRRNGRARVMVVRPAIYRVQFCLYETAKRQQNEMDYSHWGSVAA